MAITRLSGGITPGDGADPRTFPAIFNALADDIDSLSIGTAVASDGQVLTYSTAVSAYVPQDSASGTAVGGTAIYRYVDTIYYTSNDTFTKASYSWLRAIRVKLQAAGGGSGSATSNGRTSGGGGGGGYAEKFVTDIASLSASESIVVGAGGAGASSASDAAGAAGGNSSAFGGTALGGGGGEGSLGSPAFADGGTAINVDFFIKGGEGSQRLANTTSVLAGAASFLANASPGRAAAINAFGFAGEDYGGGAAMARREDASQNGGTGGDGIVILDLFA